jgi:HEAT repeat protein
MHNHLLLRIAAAVAILITGAFLGAFITITIKNSTTGKELSQLKTEVSILKKTALLTMLKEESSSNRIQAMDYAADLQNPDENVIKALFETLNHDRNVNVRMAAAYALSGFAGQKGVSDSLVQSLGMQADPILQVTLINILVERREKRALEPMKEIVRNAATLKEVKMVAERGIKVLL